MSRARENDESRCRIFALFVSLSRPRRWHSGSAQVRRAPRTAPPRGCDSRRRQTRALSRRSRCARVSGHSCAAPRAPSLTVRRRRAPRSRPLSRPPQPGCARVHLPAHRSPNFWLAAPGAAARRAHATFAPSSMFDAFKSALFGAGASFAIPDAFSLDDLASLSRKCAHEGRAVRGERRRRRGRRPSGDAGLKPRSDRCYRARVDGRGEGPTGHVETPEHRRVAERANALMTASSRDAATENAFADETRRGVRRRVGDSSTPPCSRW